MKKNIKIKLPIFFFYSNKSTDANNILDQQNMRNPGEGIFFRLAAGASARPFNHLTPHTAVCATALGGANNFSN